VNCSSPGQGFQKLEPEPQALQSPVYGSGLARLLSAGLGRLRASSLSLHITIQKIPSIMYITTTLHNAVKGCGAPSSMSTTNVGFNCRNVRKHGNIYSCFTDVASDSTFAILFSVMFFSLPNFSLTLNDLLKIQLLSYQIPYTHCSNVHSCSLDNVAMHPLPCYLP